MLGDQADGGPRPAARPPRQLDLGRESTFGQARLGALFRVQGEKTTKLPKAEDGDVVAVAKVDGVKAGDWLGSGALPPPVEAAAYYVVAEALANAAKHAAACLITVRVAFEDGLLVTEVADDGCGGADENGGGLQGLADRVASIGGRLAVSSIPGAGTALRAEIPA